MGKIVFENMSELCPNLKSKCIVGCYFLSDNLWSRVSEFFYQAYACMISAPILSLDLIPGYGGR